MLTSIFKLSHVEWTRRADSGDVETRARSRHAAVRYSYFASHKLHRTLSSDGVVKSIVSEGRVAGCLQPRGTNKSCAGCSRRVRPRDGIPVASRWKSHVQDDTERCALHQIAWQQV
jgi:hypothetical protein